MKKSVLILGAGIAGLTAARELRRRNFSVTIIESQDRPGGRIRTIQHRRVPIELGAEFVHGLNPPLLATLKEAGIRTQKVSDKSRQLENGKLKELELWDFAGDVFQRINPDGPDSTFEAFLAKQKDLKAPAKAALRHFVEDFNAAHANRISAQALLRAENSAREMNGSEQLRPATGYCALVDFLVRDFENHGGVLLKNTRATELSWQHRRVTCFFERHGHTDSIAADMAVVTLPLGVLKRQELKFRPPLPDKAEAIEGLEFGNVVKVNFEFQKPFWDDCGFIHCIDRPFPTWWNDPRGPILVGWAGGPHADALLPLSHGKIEEIGLGLIAEIFSVQPQWLRERLVASHYWNWAGDPNIRGAYSYIPVNGLDLPQRLAAPVAETLFFAGEATASDAQMGTVFGALESGLRAAREILEYETALTV